MSTFLKEKKMKVVAIVFLILLSPILATEKKSVSQSQPNMEEESVIQLNYERNQEWEIKRRDLQQESKVTLKGKEDVIASVQEDIREKTLKHPLPVGFLEELDALLKVLPHPEELLSIEQRQALMGFPHLENLQPIEETLSLLSVFIKKWGALAAHAELLQLYVNQTLWYYHEWTTFKDEIIDKLSRQTLLCEDLLKIYDKVSFFYMREHELAMSYAELPNILSYMGCTRDKLTHLFQAKGATLWELIRYSSLVKEFAKMHTLPESYADLSTEFFQNNANPLKAYLLEVSHTKSITVSMPDQGDHSSSKGRSPRSVPISQQSHSPLIVPQTNLLLKTRHVHSAPQSRSASPLGLRAKAETPEENFARRLQESFKQPENWDEEVSSVKKDTLLMIHANSIVEPLNKLLDYYNAFIKSYISSPTDSYDILSPKASLYIPGYPLIRIPQTLARKICSLKSHGQFCFDFPQCDEETTLAFSGYVGNLIFKKRRPLYPSEAGGQFLQFTLESLLGITSNPILLCGCDNVHFYAPKDNRQKLDANICSESCMRHPDAWDLKKNLGFVTIHKKPKGESFFDLLNQIAAGQGSFQRLHTKSVGQQILFSLLTKACVSAHNFELVRDGHKFNLKRVGVDSFLNPSFKLRNDGNHQLIGSNIFYLLSTMNEKIPDEVRNDFTSNNIFLTLAAFLTQLEKLQKDFDDLILMHNLNEEDDLQSELRDELRGLNVSKASVLGLVLGAREKSIQELIQNFTIISQQLSLPDVTYNQIFKELHPLEFNCYQQILENARRKTQETPIFFTQVIPSVIQQLRKSLEEAEQLGETPFYSAQKLDLFEHTSSLYREEINKYLEAIEELSTEKYTTNLTKEDISYQLEKISTLSEKLIALEESVEKETTTKAAREKEIAALRDATLKDEDKISRLQIELDGIVEAWEKNKHTILELRKQLERKPDLEERLAGVSKRLDEINESLKELTSRLLPEKLFQDFESKVSGEAQSFLQKKYGWAKENNIFHASVMLNAWAGMFDAEKLIIYETFVQSGSRADWTNVPVSTQHQLSTLYMNMVESNHPITKMVQDLIAHTDISSQPPNIALEILDRLLALDPNPTRYHKSWLTMVEETKKQFLATPPNVLKFLRTAGLEPEDERRVLQRAQLEQFGEYPRRIKDVTCKFSDSREKPVSHLLRQLWAGSLKLNPETDQVFFDAVLDLLLLPSAGKITPCLNIFDDPESIGFASSLSSKGGIFDLRYKVGDHYPLTQSEKWIILFNSSHLLPANIRLALSSHALPLLHLQWLKTLKTHYSDTRFHPWYIQTLIDKSSLLQRFLLTRLSFTFKDIMSALWPELTFVTQRKLLTHENDIERTLKSEACDTSQLNPVERKGVILERNGQSILPILHEWDRVHMECIRANPLNLDDAATQWVAHINPADYEPEILFRILDLATQFTIDPSKINRALWNNPKILADLKGLRASLECTKLVASFRTGIPFQNISLILKDSSSLEKPHSIYYRISGLEGDVALINELIRLVPNVTSLSLTNNELRSLKPLVATLKTLSFLTELSLKYNPIHNPAPLAEFPNLTSLDIQDTGIPNVYVTALKELIARENKVEPETIKLLEFTQAFSSGPSGTTERRAYTSIREKTPSTLLESIRDYVRLDKSLETMDQIICILEYLAEDRWLDTLVLDTPKLQLPCDVLFERLQEFDPREVAYKLLFAIKHDLPHGTQREKLLFVNNIPSMDKNCLHRLDVHSVCVKQDFLKSLGQFRNLDHLSLNDVKMLEQACVLAALPKLPQIRILNLTNNGIKTLLGLHTIEGDIKFPELNVFILNNNKIVSDMGIKFLLELNKLTYLNLRDNLLSRMPLLGNLQGLRRLDLSQNNIPLNELIQCKDTADFKFRPQK